MNTHLVIPITNIQKEIKRLEIDDECSSMSESVGIRWAIASLRDILESSAKVTIRGDEIVNDDIIYAIRPIENDGWDCPNSPTGYCDYEQEDGSFDEDSCKYCGNPDERK